MSDLIKEFLGDSGKFYGKYIDEKLAGDFKYRLEQAIKRSGWISVDDRLPKIGSHSDYDSHVVCLLENGARQICFVLDDCGTWESYEVNTSDVDVTHWMPLPNSPKQ